MIRISYLFKSALTRGRFFIWQQVHKQPLWFIRWWQDFYLKRLSRHAYKHIPLYKKLWDDCNANPNEISLDTLGKFPIVNRRTFSESTPNMFVDTHVPQAQLRWRSTSGSTGEPFKFVRSSYGFENIEDMFLIFKLWRFLVWNGVPLKKILKHLMVIQFYADSHPTQHYIPPTEWQSNPLKTLDTLKSFNANTIAGYPSQLEDLARCIEQYSLFGDVPFRYAVASGEALSDTQRKFIEHAFQCEVYDRYGLEEFFWSVACECTEHDGFHEYSEAYIIEIVNESGIPVEPGETGRVVITDLFNYAMPLIRYAPGDYGTLIDVGECRCGLSGTRFTIEHRDWFLTFGKKRLHYYHMNKAIGMKGYTDHILQWQIQKHSDSKAEIWITPSQTFSEKIADDLMHIVQEVIGNAVSLSLHKAPTLPKSKAGKALFFLDHTRTRSSR
jgi:phenylacetate-CoA ligase